MTKTKPMTDEWKQIEVISKSSPELLKIVGKHSTLWNYSKLETIEKINDLIDQATSKAREERTEEIRTKLVEFAIDGGKQPDELKGLDLYSKMLSYLKSLIQKDK